MRTVERVTTSNIDDMLALYESQHISYSELLLMLNEVEAMNDYDTDTCAISDAARARARIIRRCYEYRT